MTPRTLIIPAVPPYRLDLTVWALRRRPRNAIDRWDGTTYRRVVVVGGRPTELAVRQAGSLLRPQLVVTPSRSLRTKADEHQVVDMLDRLLGPRVDLAGWYEVAAGDERLRVLAARFSGLKPPRFPSVFEALVNGFACQQLSLVVGLELLNRLAALCRRMQVWPARLADPFPDPTAVARLSAAQCARLGFSRQKVRALLGLARSIQSGAINVEALENANDTDARARLLALRGVGRWTAEYVLLRGLGRVDVFPGDDVGAQKSLARWLGRRTPLDYAAVSRRIKRWNPYAGLVYFHLLLDGLSRAKVLDPAT